MMPPEKKPAESSLSQGASDTRFTEHVESSDCNGSSSHQVTAVPPDEDSARQPKPAWILSLSNELLRSILDDIEADPDKLVNLDRRAYLSQESFKPPGKLPPSQAQDIGHFRLACRRFSELGAMHQFARVTTRFSKKGFNRLENIARQPHLAKNVKKFSYMVPFFYVKGRQRVSAILPRLPASLGNLDVSIYESKIQEQNHILDTQEDVRVLQAALKAFVKLQHVQVLPVQDQQDNLLLTYIRQHHYLSEYVDLNWAPACLHSTQTIGEALLKSHSPCTRFSSPMLNPQSAIILAQHPPGINSGMVDSLDTLASRLTCLELHFDDGIELDSRMREFSPLFKTVFLSAKNLEAVHVGFPSHRPLSLGLEEVFHNVKWEKLLAFGIQGWKLNGQEVMDLAMRHRDRLRGLRLRDVLLKEGSMWKDMLVFLRANMVRLDWVSLRRIGYARQFDDQWAIAGAEIPDDPPGGYSSDSSDMDWAADEDDDYYGETNGHHHHHNHHSDEDELESIGSESSIILHSDDDDEDRMESNGMEFPHLPDTPVSASWCNCGGEGRIKPDNPDELGDNGIMVTNATRRIWERWVVRQCPEHG